MAIIKIKENTSIQDVNEWTINSDDEVTFKILYKSSFQLFAEGVALGVLRWIAVHKKIINIQFYKTPNVFNNFDLDSIQPILKSIFGLELLRLTKKIFNDKGEEQDIRSIIGSTLWKSILNDKGHLGDGKRAYIISRHDYKVPRCLRNTETSVEFPRYDYFQSSVGSYLLGLRGYTKIIGDQEKILIEWLHHIAENAYEHAGVSIETGGVIEGFRGIILGKFNFQNKNELQKREDVPSFIKKYIANLIRQGFCPPSGITFNYATVIDIGEGIQNTLSTPAKENEFDKLRYAFKDGVTRKTDLMNEKSGYGLGQALNAANNINAYLHIVTGNIETSIDFSQRKIDNACKSERLSSPLYLNDKCGTSISIFWPTNSINGVK